MHGVPELEVVPGEEGGSVVGLREQEQGGGEGGEGEVDALQYTLIRVGEEGGGGKGEKRDEVGGEGNKEKMRRVESRGMKRENEGGGGAPLCWAQAIR